MNWFKDNLIMLLGGATALMVVVLIVLILNLRVVKAEKAAVEAKIGPLEQAVEHNAAQARDSARRLAEVAEKHRLDLERAEFLAAELDKFKDRTQELVDENAGLRRKAAAKEPATRAYLDSGMPRSLACITWPERCQ